MCCLPNLPLAVKEGVAKTFREQMSKPDLVFITKENAEMLKAEADAQAEVVSGRSTESA